MTKRCLLYRGRSGPLALYRGVRHAAAVALLLAVTPYAASGQDQLSGRDLSDRIQQRVLEVSPAVAAARAALAAAHARMDGAGLAPPVVLSSEMEEVLGGYDISGAAFRVELGREFLTGGRTAAARALTLAEAEIAAARLAVIERRIRAGVMRELTRYAAAEAIARRLAAEDTLLVAAGALVQDRFSVGEARYVDVIRLRAERLHVQTNRSEALAGGRAALEALLGLVVPERRAELAALADEARVEELDLVPLPSAPNVDSLLALAGPVLQAEALVGRARAARALAVAQQRRRVAASLGAQRKVQPDGGNAFGPVLTASITLPFTARRANRAERLAAEWEVEAAELTRAAVLGQVRSGLAGALARYHAARDRLAVYDAALLAAAREERESALSAYRTGALTLLELLDFERALARAEIDRIRARTDAVDAYANLTAATADAGAERPE